MHLLRLSSLRLVLELCMLHKPPQSYRDWISKCLSSLADGTRQTVKARRVRGVCMYCTTYSVPSQEIRPLRPFELVSELGSRKGRPKDGLGFLAAFSRVGP